MRKIIMYCVAIFIVISMLVISFAAADTPQESTNAQMLHQVEEGARLVQQQKLEAAAEHLKVAMEIDPPDYDAQFKYATVLADLGKYNEAIAILQTIAAVKPQDEDVWATLGNCYASISAYAKASEAYGKACGLTKSEARQEQLCTLIKAMIKEVSLLAVEGIEDKSDDKDYYTEATAVGFGRWQKMPVTVYISPDPKELAFKPEFRAILRGAFDEWTAVTNGKLRFSFVGHPEDADIRCIFSGDRRLIVNKAEAGHSRILQDRNDGITKVNIVLLLDSALSENLMSNNRFHKVALHEIGHAIGLLGHSSDRADIMFPIVDDSPTEAKLSQRDIATALRVYTAPPPRKPVPLQKMARSNKAQRDGRSADSIDTFPPLSTQAYEALYACSMPNKTYTSKYVYDGKGNIVIESTVGDVKTQFMFFKQDGGTYFIDDQRKLGMRVAGKPDDYDAYMCQWNKYRPTGLVSLGEKIVASHPSHGYSGKVGMFNGEVWIADDIGIPVKTASTRFKIHTESELTSFRKLAPSEVPEIAVPSEYEITTAAEYCQDFESKLPSDWSR